MYHDDRPPVAKHAPSPIAHVQIPNCPNPYASSKKKVSSQTTHLKAGLTKANRCRVTKKRKSTNANKIVYVETIGPDGIFFMAYVDNVLPGRSGFMNPYNRLVKNQNAKPVEFGPDHWDIQCTQYLYL